MNALMVMIRMFIVLISSLAKEINSSYITRKGRLRHGGRGVLLRSELEHALQKENLCQNYEHADMAATAASLNERSTRAAPHPVLSRPALLSHVLKFAVRNHKDVTLMYVNGATWDTAVNYCALIWERLLLAESIRKPPPPLSGGALSIEEHSQALFNHFVCRVWARDCYKPSILGRLIAPRAVDLSGCVFLSDDDLRTLCGLPLEYLDLASCKHLTVAGMLHLRALAGSIQHLGVSWCRAMVSDASISQAVEALVLLRSLNVSWCRITNAATAAIARHLPALEALDVSGCGALADASHISQLSNLRSLKLSHCNKLISEPGMAQICTLSQLEHLHISGVARLTDRCAMQLAKLTSLRVLNVSGCCSLTPDGVGAVCVGADGVGASTLQVLDLSCCSEITDAVFTHISDLPALRSVNVASCNQLSRSAKRKFKEDHPNCDVVG